MPFFSIIIPNYNHSRYLRQRIESVLNQTYTDFEVVIIDDCSIDSSREVIETYRGTPKIVKIIYHQVNSGSPFRPWEEGIQHANGEFVWIAESDDFADPQFLEIAKTRIMSHSDIGLLFTNSRLVDEQGNDLKETTALLNNKAFATDKWNSDYFANGIDEINTHLKLDCIPYNVSSVVFKKTLFDKVAPQLQYFRFIGDWFFYVSVAFETNVYYTSLPLNFYRRHALSHFAKQDLIQLKAEYFKIFRLLFRHSAVGNKRFLLNYFAYHHLSFGLIDDGLRKGLKIIRKYFRDDRTLAVKVVLRILEIKLLRRKAPRVMSGSVEQKLPSAI
jgi:glycosyltransferase involved in cell wall biosynthesis